MKILIVTSCTGQKATNDTAQLTLADFQKGTEFVRKREAKLIDLMLPARDMYTGQQHTRLMEGINAAGNDEAVPLSVDLWILSAGYGLISGNRTIAPYECTFKELTARERQKWADVLGVPTTFRKIVAAEYNLGILLLGGEYLKACRLDSSIRFCSATVAFCGSTVHVPKVANLKVVGLVEEHTRIFSCGNLGLKGELGTRLLNGLRSGKISPTIAADRTLDLLDILKTVSR